MKKNWIVVAGVLLIVVGGLAGAKTLQIRKLIAGASAYAPPPESISSAVVHEERWQETLEAIGSITAAQGVTITPELAGTVREIAFESGAVVAKGDLLVRLDTSSEEAQLRATEAQAELARLNAIRARALRADNTMSQADLDAAEATLKEYQANADSIRATIDKKILRAPFAGRLGIRLVNLGEYLDPGKPVVSLQSVTPVYADFWLPQQELSRLKTGMRVRLATDSVPSRRFDGTLTAINPDLDPSTRSVRLQATFDNADQLLRPGVFARIEVLLPSEQTLLVIPATAVLRAPYGDSVYVIERQAGTNGPAPGLVVRQQFVRTGRSRGDFLSVETGAKAGEVVASAGVFKLRNGMAVVVETNLPPMASEKPLPPNS